MNVSPVSGCLHCHPHLDPVPGRTRFRRAGEPQPAQLAIRGDRFDLRKMLAGKGFQRHPAVARQGHGIDEAAHDTLRVADHAASIAHTDSSTAASATAAAV